MSTIGMEPSLTLEESTMLERDPGRTFARFAKGGAGKSPLIFTNLLFVCL